ncbi:unnamed protein product [Medioppia subpectinata]|uniref:Carboxypeptidase n=1 Tax=Medioppia subpectinata TaxID=1979941 RepID=A0A7R9KV64_9ACAR|nr:unnamed protein product [Medioppia subpectinata]CAG2110470.1 unnamed protein product [Medioppia subpectinata]
MAATLSLATWSSSVAYLPSILYEKPPPHKEQGPLHVDPNGRQLYPNENSWNRAANMLFLEAPAGVGFSYKMDGKYATDDDQVARDNVAAIECFYRKFPQFKTNDFYLMGESYAGIYVPTLSVQILNAITNASAAPVGSGGGLAGLNFKGFAVGNGYLDQKMLGNSLLTFGYYHGLYDHYVWDALVNSCCPPVANGSTVAASRCDFVSNRSAACVSAVSRASGFIREPGLNVYNLYADCWSPSDSTFGAILTASVANITGKYSRETFDHRLMIGTLNLTDERPLLDKLSVTPPCIDASFVEHWVNDPVVRRDLHIPDAVQQWTSCSLPVMAGYRNIYTSMKAQVQQLLASDRHLKGLIYNGDVDMACNFLGDEWFVEDLNRTLVSEYKAWNYNKQIAGFYKVYDRLAFATVRGSGHMVPTDKAGAALEMFEKFINSPASALKLH